MPAKSALGIFLYILISFFFSSPALAQVVINEILPDPENGEEFIELYNQDSETIDLSICTLADENAKDKPTPLSGEIYSGSYKVFYESEVGFKLNNSGDNVYFSCSNGQDDLFGYSSSKKGKSISCIPDGSTNCNNQTDPTPNEANPTPTPIPTNTPTPTLTPTNTPTPTNAPTPTKTPTPTSKPASTSTPTNTKTPTPSPTGLSRSEHREGLPEGEQEQVLSASDSATKIPTDSPTPTGGTPEGSEPVENSKPSQNNTTLFIGLGLLATGGSLFAYKKFRLNKLQ